MKEYIVAPNDQYIIRTIKQSLSDVVLELIIKYEHHPDVGVTRPPVATMLNVVKSFPTTHIGGIEYEVLPHAIVVEQLKVCPPGHFSLLVKDDFFSLIDPIKLIPYLNLSGKAYKEFPFLLVCKNPELYIDQIAYWKNESNKCKEMDALIKSITQTTEEPKQATGNEIFAKELRVIADKLEQNEIGINDTCIVILAEGDIVRDWKISGSTTPKVSLIGMLESAKHSLLIESKVDHQKTYHGNNNENPIL